MSSKTKLRRSKFKFFNGCFDIVLSMAFDLQTTFLVSRTEWECLIQLRRRDS